MSTELIFLGGLSFKEGIFPKNLWFTINACIILKHKMLLCHISYLSKTICDSQLNYAYVLGVKTIIWNLGRNCHKLWPKAPRLMPPDICPQIFAPGYLTQTFAPGHLLPGICPLTFAPRQLPPDICLQTYVPGYLPLDICPRTFASGHLPPDICPHLGSICLGANVWWQMFGGIWFWGHMVWGQMSWGIFWGAFVRGQFFGGYFLGGNWNQIKYVGHPRLYLIWYV